MSANMSAAAVPQPIISLRLYIAGEAPSSRRALQNIQQICSEIGRTSCDLEIVDVLADPVRALNDRVLVTPTLVRLSPRPVIKIVDDLKDRHKLVDILRHS